MALPQVIISLNNGALGLSEPTDDALAGLILQGPAASDLPLSTPLLITSLADAEQAGIDEDYDTANTVSAFKAIKEFYAEAGAGKRLWIMIVSQAISMATIFDKDEADHAVKLLNAAAGGIRILSIQRDPASGYTPVITDGLDADVAAAITKAQALGGQYTSEYKPLRIVLPAFGYNGTASGLPDLKTRTDNRVAVMIGDTVSGDNVATGLLLGRLAAVQVMEKVAKVRLGALSNQDAYLNTETIDEAGNDVAIIHDKGFITFRRHVGFAGYYFTDDPTATAGTDDYSSLVNGRVIDKAYFLAYRAFVGELLGEIRVNPDTGRIQRQQAKYYQVLVERAIDAGMTANDEINSVTAFVDPAQDVLSTQKLCVQLRIVPVGYASTIEVELGFSNPNL